MVVGLPMCADAASGPARQRTARSNRRLPRWEDEGPIAGSQLVRCGPLDIGLPCVTPISTSSKPLSSPLLEESLLTIVATGRISRQRLRQRISQRQTQAHTVRKIGKLDVLRARGEW